jgi:hypothetical protein
MAAVTTVLIFYDFTLSWGLRISKADIIERLETKDFDTPAIIKASKETAIDGIKFWRLQQEAYGHEFNFRQGEFSASDVARISEKMNDALAKAELEFANHQMPLRKILEWSLYWLLFWALVYLLGISVAWIRRGF